MRLGVLICASLGMAALSTWRWWCTDVRAAQLGWSFAAGMWLALACAAALAWWRRRALKAERAALDAELGRLMRQHRR